MLHPVKRRYLFKQIDMCPFVLKSIRKAKYSNAETQVEEKVIISPRIERRPTDILEALSSTVGMKSTAFHYKYPDDPYFYPLSCFFEKMYALALESGRKSARFVFKENPKFFKNHLSEPLIKKFIPKEVEETELEATEKSLDCAIKERNVLEAIRVYKTLLERNVKVSSAMKQYLLELVSFFNSQEKPDVEVEEKWFFNKASEVQNTWQATNFATELFESMDPNCPLATSTMIQGMLKHNDIDSALDLYESAKVKKIRLSVGVYNALLSKLHIIKSEHVKDAFASIKDVLNEMSHQNIKPNLGTLNSTLNAISELETGNKFKLAQRIINEFLKLGIEPSLGSFGFLFSCMRDPSFVPFADSLLESIEHNHHQVLHPTDLKFFCSAMRTIDHDLKSPDLAIRLMDMFNRNNNIRFIVYLEERDKFYRHFCFALFKNLMIDTAMEIYKSYSLTRFYPDTSLYRLILSSINKFKQYHYLPALWKEMEFAKAVSQQKLMRQILEMVNDIQAEEELKVCHAAAITYLNDKNRLNEIRSDTWSNIVVSLLKNQDYTTFESFWLEIQNYFDILNWSENAIREMYNYGMSKKNQSFILEILKIAKDSNHPNISAMASDALPLLGENDKNLVHQILKESETQKSNDKKMSNFQAEVSGNESK